MSTTENSTSDSSKLTNKTPRSKASSTEAEVAPAEAPEATEATDEPSDCFPLYLRKLRGFGATLGAIDDARRKQRLPSLNPTDYRFILQRPGGIPFSFPVQVVYKPGDAKEKDLGTFRIGR